MLLEHLENGLLLRHLKFNAAALEPYGEGIRLLRLTRCGRCEPFETHSAGRQMPGKTLHCLHQGGGPTAIDGLTLAPAGNRFGNIEELTAFIIEVELDVVSGKSAQLFVECGALAASRGVDQSPRF